MTRICNNSISENKRLKWLVFLFISSITVLKGYVFICLLHNVYNNLIMSKGKYTIITIEIIL